MSGIRAYIAGMGVVGALGMDTAAVRNALRQGVTGIRPLSVFELATRLPLPVGEVPGPIHGGDIPRTHRLARLAADQAMAGSDEPPGAIVMGTTTGGMLKSETVLKQKHPDPEEFRLHAVGSVAEDLARRYRCTGPVITVSTACSSGAVAVKLALAMLRSGNARRVLAGGADSLCRLTYFGFNSLQLIDPEGARPLDRSRKGMSVAEGAAVLLLTVDRPAGGAAAEILGAGLSCDAYHPTAPHPDGRGALAAMRNALADAGISAARVDYINLHGTGTCDNDLAEARAVNALFKPHTPLLSSVKGAFGHPLAAAGAIETVVSALNVAGGWVPASTGCGTPDPQLELAPLKAPRDVPVNCVLSNSFGFGGNNAAVVIASPGRFDPPAAGVPEKPLRIFGQACITGAGDTRSTLAAVSAGAPCSGLWPLERVSENLPPRTARRLKRLPRLALALALAAVASGGGVKAPSSVFWGTGWGAQSETHDFLTRLYETDEKFPSPTDFVGSVHNAPAGLVALHFGATGPNVTTSGGDYSFEQALLAARLITPDGADSLLVIGADEFHPVLSPLFDRSVAAAAVPSDGGGALWLGRSDGPNGRAIDLVFYHNAENDPGAVAALIDRLGGAARIRSRYGAILAGIPGAVRPQADRQLQAFLQLTGFSRPIVDYRRFVGEFAAASTVAAVLAARFAADGRIPLTLCRGEAASLDEKGVLILGLGRFVTAVEVM